MEQEKMEESSELSTAEISGFVTSTKEQIRSELEEKEYTPEELEKLIEAEKAGKGRKTVLNMLKNKEKRWNIQKDMDLAENEIKDLEKTLEDLEKRENIQTQDENDRRDVSEEELIELLGKNVKDIKEFVREQRITIEGLENILEGEKKIKNRKTAKKFLEKRIRKLKIKEDAEETEKDIEKLKEDIVEMKADEKTTEVSESLEKGLKEKEDGGNDQQKESNEDEEQEETNNQQQEVDDNEEKENQEEKGEESKESEEKKEIAEGLEVDISDEEIQAMSLEDIKELKSEVDRRNELISSLEEQGLEKEDLENASNSDLEKLYDQVKDSESQEEKDKKSKEEIREEAEEDLQMLMGAGKNSEEEEEDTSEDRRKDAKERIEEFKDNLRQKMSRDDKEIEDSSGFEGEKIIDKLDAYENVSDREAAVKTAHILKGYLEYRLHIDRELTYEELAKNLPVQEYDDMQKISDFFNKMQEDEYTKNIEINDMDEIIEKSKKLIRELEG